MNVSVATSKIGFLVMCVYYFPQPKDSTLVTGMLSGGSGLISFEQRITSGEKSKEKSEKTERKKLAAYNVRRGDEVTTSLESAKYYTFTYVSL